MQERLKHPGVTIAGTIRIVKGTQVGSQALGQGLTEAVGSPSLEILRLWLNKRLEQRFPEVPSYPRYPVGLVANC